MKTYSKIPRAIVAVILAICMAIGAFLPAKPAHAILGMGDTVSDFLTEAESTLSAVYNGLTSAYEDIASYAEDEIWIKDYILDPLAWAAAKSMLQTITNQTVSWINSGFKGSPAYITNPTSFFENVADQATGAFLANNGPLSSLCSPISLNVRLAIALNMAGGSGNTASGGSSPYACTLSTVINNVQGATINGFEAGDFSQGGWPAFASLAEPQNNFYGAYLEAQSQLDVSIANRTAEQNNQLNRGSGFLSFTTCTPDPTITDDDATYDETIQSTVDANGNVVYEHCNISTPGSTIKASLDKALGSSQDSLVQASMLDEIIGALASQLVNQVLGPGGLAGVTQSQNGQPAYLTQVEAETNASNAATINNLGSTLGNQISTYEPYAVQQQSDYSGSVDTANGAIETFGSYIATCQSASSTPATIQAISMLNGFISTTTNILNASLQPGYDATTNYVNNLNSLSVEINNATSTGDISTLTEQVDSIQPPLNDMPVSESNVKNDITSPANTSIESLISEANTIVAQYCYGTPNPVTVTGTAAQNYMAGNGDSLGNDAMPPL